ncbi:hypothetical protein, partial [Mesorhizobium silamurunense]|uniref:hypothetical protein n=1 Tax=Mesorhizobium silamurunense TaxID=499528 RepID=UPI001AEE8FFA
VTYVSRMDHPVLAGVPGFEPGLTESESAISPAKIAILIIENQTLMAGEGRISCRAMLQMISLDFQGLQTAIGNSTRHGRDMEKPGCCDVAGQFLQFLQPK